MWPFATQFLLMSSILPSNWVVQKRTRTQFTFNIHHLGGSQMKTLKVALVALMLTGFFSTQARANDHAVNGLLIGTAVGGMMGYIVGNEMDKGHYDRRPIHHQPVVHIPPPPPPRYIPDRRYSRHAYRSDEVCRKTIVVRERHGRYRETVRTVCEDRDDWHRPHHRGDRYRDYDRW